MQGALSLGIVMIALGVMSVSFGGPTAPTPAAYVIAGGLVAAGVILILKRPFSFHVALAATTILIASGLVAFAGRPDLGLPFAPGLSLGIGVYLLLRIAVGRVSYSRTRRPPPE